MFCSKQIRIMKRVLQVRMIKEGIYRRQETRK
uniref:Uncharacterized protein n=1 Tax=Rhizophora mucronata TaxID=61149 RepID=A0A2P2JBU0_RHIMU